MNLAYKQNKKAIERFFVKHDLHTSVNGSEELIFDKCPYCGKSRKLYLNPESTLWVCFSCNKKGNIITLIKDLDDVSTYQAYRILREGQDQLYGINPKVEAIQRALYSEPTQEKVSFVLIEQRMPNKFEPFTFEMWNIEKYQEYYRYLIKRGLTKDMVRYFNILIDPDTQRIVFPVYFMGKLVGYQKRTIIDGVQPKAITGPTGYKKSHYLYNYDNVLDSEYIMIVEGPIDACKTYKHNSVALFGKEMSEIQFLHIQKLSNLKTVYIGIDPEEKKAKEKLYRQLSALYTCKLVDIELGSDCGDKTPEEIDKYFQEAKDFTYLKL